VATHDAPELLEMLGGPSLLAIQQFAEDKRAEFLAVVGEVFDISGSQKVVRARPTEVTKLAMKDGHLVARVQLHIVYRNPIEQGDRDLAAENSTTYAVDVRFVELGADLTVDGIEAVLDEMFAE
jgi:hypothetical protein